MNVITHKMLEWSVTVCVANRFVICFYFKLYTHFFLVTKDINQCESNNGGCGQNCTNLLPGFECSCLSGYILDEDGRTCLG